VITEKMASSPFFQPGCDIGCVTFARFQCKLQVGAQESGTEFRYKFLDRVTFAPEAMPAEVTVEPGLAACLARSDAPLHGSLMQLP
jgi:hypothetical protein